MAVRNIAGAMSVLAAVAILAGTSACQSSHEQGGPAVAASRPPLASQNPSPIATQPEHQPTPAVTPPASAITHPTEAPTITPKQTATTNAASANATSIFEVGVTTGAFCSDVGARGITKDGQRVTCTSTAVDHRLRWWP